MTFEVERAVKQQRQPTNQASNQSSNHSQLLFHKEHTCGIEIGYLKCGLVVLWCSYDLQVDKVKPSYEGQ